MSNIFKLSLYKKILCEYLDTLSQDIILGLSETDVSPESQFKKSRAELTQNISNRIKRNFKLTKNQNKLLGMIEMELAHQLKSNNLVKDVINDKTEER